MNSPRVKVHIPKPCSKNWAAMLPAQQGRFCLSCQKTVVDFTQKSDAEILAYFTQNPKGCGRFYRDQVLQPHELPKNIFQRWKASMVAVSVLIAAKLTLPSLAIAQSPAHVNLIAGHQEGQKEEPVFAPDGNLYLRGTIIDPENEKPLEGVKVFVTIVRSNPSNNYGSYGGYREVSYYEGSPYRALTDANGKYEIVIPAVELGDQMNRINFQLPGYTSLTELINYAEARRPMVKYLEKESNIPQIGPEYYGREIIQGGGQSIAIMEVGSRRRKPYYTRAGFVLAKAAFPYWWVKSKVQNWRDDNGNY